ncbi:MAG TPA: hypothetical protein VMR50_09980 [Myxococcota bacterium]|nr:hypothetical protein [Myxococcota bacterium]
MSSSAYSPPEAELTRPDPAGRFYAVSAPKLVVMSIATFGFFELWWHYKNWCVFCDSGERLRPGWRAVFAPFTAYWLFKRLAERGRQASLELTPSAGVIGVLYFVVNLASTLTGGLELGSLVLLPANTLARKLNEARSPESPAVVGWSTLNLCWLAVGIPLVALAMVGNFLERAR